VKMDSNEFSPLWFLVLTAPVTMIILSGVYYYRVCRSDKNDGKEQSQEEKSNELEDAESPPLIPEDQHLNVIPTAAESGAQTVVLAEVPSDIRAILGSGFTIAPAPPPASPSPAMLSVLGTVKYVTAGLDLQQYSPPPVAGGALCEGADSPEEDAAVPNDGNEG